MRYSSHFKDLYSMLHGFLGACLRPTRGQLCAWRTAGGGVWGVNGTERVQTRGFSLTSAAWQVAAAHSRRLSRTEGICRQKTRDGGTERPAEAALGNQPFMSRRLALSFRGSYLFATEAALQILAVLLHLLLLHPHHRHSLFPTLCSYTLHLSNAQKRTGAQWGVAHTSLHWCSDRVSREVWPPFPHPPPPPSPQKALLCSALLDSAAARVILEEWSITGQGCWQRADHCRLTSSAYVCILNESLRGQSLQAADETMYLC